MFASDLSYVPQDVRGWNLRPDFLVHGSPCQDFSIAGHQKGADPGSETRSSLMWETLKIIDSLGKWRPKVVIWENVPNVLSKHMKRNFDRYITEMERMGYVSSYEKLNAMDFGLPQNRIRVFTVSILGGPAFDFSKLEKRPMKPIKELLEPLDEPGKYKLCPSMIDAVGHKRPGSNFQGCCPIITDYCNTITTAQDRVPNAGVILCPNGEYRMLTPLEAFRLFGYDDEDYKAALSANPGRKGFRNNVLYKQAGNSMPVPILESIFKEALKLEDILVPMENVPPQYIVRQPSVLRAIGKKGISRATVIKDSLYTITCRQDRLPAQVVPHAWLCETGYVALGYRYLMEIECFRAQGFTDDDYKAAESACPQVGRFRMPLYKQAGNSMPVPVLEAIFTELLHSNVCDGEGGGMTAWIRVNYPAQEMTASPIQGRYNKQLMSLVKYL